MKQETKPQARALVGLTENECPDTLCSRDTTFAKRMLKEANFRIACATTPFLIPRFVRELNAPWKK
ncbi:MAG: hypothetical protein ACRCTU_15770 [Zoogloea sp.]|uniref:hypothetical protein n=1 Tax=Zoogloea sp. TaxID=49181 RepID=UPI003F30A666